MTRWELKDVKRVAAAFAGAIRSGDAAEVDRWQHTLIALECTGVSRRRHLVTRR